MILQKGIAGIGNRFQVLAACCATGQHVFADWRDTSFRGKFSDVFYSDQVTDFEPGSVTDPVYPAWWTSHIDNPCAKQLAGDHFRSARISDSDQYERIVVCKYNAMYPPCMLKIIRPNAQVYNFAEMNMHGVGPYRCWHVRATDKNADTDKIIHDIINVLTPGLQKVVITDSRYVRDCLCGHRIYCPSDIPPVPKRGGIHHMSDRDLSAAGMTKRQLNLSCVSDLVIAARADVFDATCPHSSYSQLIETAREEGSWRKQWA